MSIIYNEQEQKQLQELQKNAEGFANFRNLVARSLYSGQDSVLAAQLLQFLTQMAQDSAKGIEQINATAEARSKKSDSTEKTEEKLKVVKEQ